MPAPKGNQYAKGCKTSGTPKIWDDDAITAMAHELREWIKADTGVYLNSFCVDKKIHPQRLTEWVDVNKEFADAYSEAKVWQEAKFIRKSLVKEWDGSFARYVMARTCGDKWKASFEQPESQTIEHIGNITINKISKKT
jgi:hypothetical protein